MPGVFYRRPDPEEPMYVEKGDSVSEGDVVGIVGVMKNFHDITAPADGTIVDVLAENEQEIEAGDPLFELET
jgi:acetyl-CoA carboxylase biotin carboxyl carrier protein